jgi:Na+-transporting NADH:ubiquinone oxidoreductase subunit NqrB
MLYKREKLEEIEHQALAAYGLRSRDTQGRQHPDREPDYRTSFQRDRRYIAPLLITVILIGAHWGAGVLRGYEAIALAIVAAIVTDLVVGRLLMCEKRALASAYISGISIGILVRSPLLWPYALGASISILSKYVLRLRGRHLWNPSNFGICVLLFLAPSTVAPLSVQWGNALWPMLIIWAIGIVAVWRAGRAHITIAYLAAFVIFAVIRSMITGHTILAEVAPLTGPMYQLFALFMVTDPKTTVKSKSWGIVVVVIVAAVEMMLRLAEVVYAPFYALFIVGPIALVIETMLIRRVEEKAVLTTESRSHGDEFNRRDRRDR